MLRYLTRWCVDVLLPSDFRCGRFLQTRASHGLAFELRLGQIATLGEGLEDGFVLLEILFGQMLAALLGIDDQPVDGIHVGLTRRNEGAAQ